MISHETIKLKLMTQIFLWFKKRKEYQIPSSLMVNLDKLHSHACNASHETLLPGAQWQTLPQIYCHQCLGYLTKLRNVKCSQNQKISIPMNITSALSICEGQVIEPYRATIENVYRVLLITESWTQTEECCGHLKTLGCIDYVFLAVTEVRPRTWYRACSNHVYDALVAQQSIDNRDLLPYAAEQAEDGELNS